MDGRFTDPGGGQGRKNHRDLTGDRHALQPLQSPTVWNRDLHGVSTGGTPNFNCCHRKKLPSFLGGPTSSEISIESNKTAVNNLN